MTFRRNVAICLGVGLSLAALAVSDAALAAGATVRSAAAKERKPAITPVRAEARQPGVPTREEIMALMADRCSTR